MYDAALRRAGILRVHGIEDLFAAVETLARARPLQGERLAIRPYPPELEERVDLSGRDVLLRPIRPEDEPAHR